MTIPEIVVRTVLHRIKHGDRFTDGELDFILALSSRHTDQIVEHLDDEEIIKFSGLLRDRQEELAALLTV